MESEIQILTNIFGNKNYKVYNDKLEVENYEETLSFDDIRILKFKSENITYIVYIHNLDIPYKLNMFDETFFRELKEVYYNCNKNYSIKLKRFGGILEKLNLTKDDLEKIIVKNKYLDIYYWGSYYESYPFDDVYDTKYSRYEINKMNIYALRQYDDDDIFEINVLTRYSKSKVTFKIYENALFIELNYNSLSNKELEKFYKSTQYIPNNLPIDLYLALKQFHLLNYNNIFELDPLTINHFKYSSLLVNNSDINEVINYLKLLKELYLDCNELKIYRNDLINLITLNNIIKDINSQDILDIINNNKNDTEENIIIKIKDYLINYLNEYKTKKNILSEELINLEKHNNDFLNLHIDNLVSKFINN